MKAEMEAIDRAAAAWLSRYEAGLSAGEAAEFARWLEGDPRHRQSFHGLQSAWSDLDRLRGSRMAAQLETELDDIAAAPTNHRLAAVAPSPRRGYVGHWLAGALAACLAWGLVYFVGWSPSRRAAAYAESAQTGVGDIRTLELPDGSLVKLNTDTAVEVIYTTAERRVRLSQGEAFFIVAKNRTRPFIVTASGIGVRAVGTEFNVRLKSQSVEVVVREGKVRVDDVASGTSLLRPQSEADSREGAPPLLETGQRVSIPITVPTSPAPMPAPATPEQLADTEVDRSLAWQEQRLVFESAPLATIVAEFNRYNRQQIVIADAELAARRFGGTFVATDSRTFLELLRSTYDVAIDENATKSILRLHSSRR
jgi:transmembrane sensor